MGHLHRYGPTGGHRLIRVLTGADIHRALPMADAIDAMRSAFSAFSSGEASVPPRTVLGVGGAGTTLVMPAFLPPDALVTKTVSVFPRNAERAIPVIHGLVALIDVETGRPIAILDGGTLTAVRTGAASGVAADLLARRDAEIGALIGCGPQARTQAHGIDTVRRLKEIRVFGRDSERVRRFIDAVAPEVRASVVPAASAAEAAAGAAIVCTATSAREPVIGGAAIEPGAHVNAIGSFTLAMRELDVELIGRARIFVDSVEAALDEAGELVAAVEAGATRVSDWIEIGDVAAGRARGRSSATEITIFKSVGLAVQDAAAAVRAYRSAVEQGLGSEVAL